MATAEMKTSAMIFSILFIIIGASGIILAFSPYFDWPSRLFSGIVGAAIIVGILVGMKKIKDD